MQAARIQVVVITGQREVKLIISTGHAATGPKSLSMRYNNHGGQLEHSGAEYPASAWYSCNILVFRCKRSFCPG